MKLIHCADLHLDAPMTGLFDREQAAVRRGELLHTFARMVDYAVQHDMTAILIAGDLFDGPRTSAGSRQVVLSVMAQHPELLFFWLKGNHDRQFANDRDDLPDNLHLFEERWKKYRIGNVVITGTESCGAGGDPVYDQLKLDADRCNIVLMHGQEYETGGQGDPDAVCLRALRHKNIDYLALGHVHFYKKEVLDDRGIYCYPGCLEGRGYDECGIHGFEELDIDEDHLRIRSRFVPFAYRTLHCVDVDVTACSTAAELYDAVERTLDDSRIPEKDMVRVTLTGDLDVSVEWNRDWLEHYLGDRYFHLQVRDESRRRFSTELYLHDPTLRGAFVRSVMADESLSEDERGAIVRIGLLALAGEEAGE